MGLADEGTEILINGEIKVLRLNSKGIPSWRPMSSPPKRNSSKPKRRSTKPKRRSTKPKRRSTKPKRRSTKPKRRSTKPKTSERQSAPKRKLAKRCPRGSRRNPATGRCKKTKPVASYFDANDFDQDRMPGPLSFYDGESPALQPCSYHDDKGCKSEGVRDRCIWQMGWGFDKSDGVCEPRNKAMVKEADQYRN
jgi:hypothetical protein